MRVTPYDVFMSYPNTTNPNRVGTNCSVFWPEKWAESGLDNVKATPYDVLLSYPNTTNPNREGVHRKILIGVCFVQWIVGYFPLRLLTKKNQAIYLNRKSLDKIIMTSRGFWLYKRGLTIVLPSALPFLKCCVHVKVCMHCKNVRICAFSELMFGLLMYYFMRR